MTIYYPDISSYQAGVSINGAPAVCVKATEGSNYANPDYAAALRRASSASAFGFAYHFLHSGNSGGQAGWCRQHVGSTPLMLDFEPSGSSKPTMGDATGFLDSFKGDGGICHLCYLPNWYWQQLGKPSLQPLINRGCSLVSSNYTTYTDDIHGAGWQAYGGMTPAVWQYTDRKMFNGKACDFNAFKGTIAQLRALAGAGAAAPAPGPRPPAPPAGKAPVFPYPSGHYLGQPSSSAYCHSGYYGGPDHTNVNTWQNQMVRRGWTLAQDGQFGPASDKVARAFQAEKGLAVDGKVGASTWAASWTAPVS